MTLFGPGPDFALPTFHGPALRAPTTYLDVREQVEPWFATLWPTVAIPSGHAWAAIVAWAADAGLPLMHTPATPGSGPKLACTDPQTQATVVAYCLDRLSKAGTPDDYVSIAASDGSGWDVDPGNGEHSLPPSDRLAILAAVVAEAIAPARPVIQAYGPTVVPPTVPHHSQTVVVVYKSYAAAYLPDGETVGDQIQGHHTAGALQVQPAIGWTDWYVGEPGTSFLFGLRDVADVVAWPRFGEPDTLQGAIAGTWVALHPYLYALAAAVRHPSPTVATLRAAIDEFTATVYGPAADFVGTWYRLQEIKGASVVPMYAALRGAFELADDPIAVRLCRLVQATRWLELLRSGDGTAQRAWAWSCPYALDLRMISGAVFGEPQGGPPSGTDLDPSVDDPVHMAQIVREQLADSP